VLLADGRDVRARPPPSPESYYNCAVTLALAGLVVLAAAFVKGAIAFGFPTLGTPLLSLVTDVKTAVVVLIMPNIAMDGIQFVRQGAPRAIVQRFWTLLMTGAVGTVIGTRLLADLSPRTASLVLSLFILLFVAASASGRSPRVTRASERWVSPLVGLAVGVIGGVTNVHGTPLVMYFVALGLAKHDFVAAVSFTFVVYKLVQLGAVAYFGLLSEGLMLWSVVLTLVALAGFAAGLRVQDRLDPRTFRRATLGFLAVLGTWLLFRSVR
jgi:uncharacterized protein